MSILLPLSTSTSGPGENGSMNFGDMLNYYHVYTLEELQATHFPGGKTEVHGGSKLTQATPQICCINMYYSASCQALRLSSVDLCVMAIYQMEPGRVDQTSCLGLQ